MKSQKAEDALMKDLEDLSKRTNRELVDRVRNQFIFIL